MRQDAAPGAAGESEGVGGPAAARRWLYRLLGRPASPCRSNSRQEAGRCPQIEQRTGAPTSPSSATQRGLRRAVPAIERKSGATWRVNSTGTLPPGASELSPRQNDTRRTMPPAPHVEQGDVAAGVVGASSITALKLVADKWNSVIDTPAAAGRTTFGTCPRNAGQRASRSRRRMRSLGVQ
jgi:hypothetical protein